MMKLPALLGILLVTLATGAAPALAAPTPLDADLAAGVLSAADALMQRFYAVFDSEQLDSRYEHLLGEAPSCATSLLAEIDASWDSLTPAQRHVVDLRTDPWYRAWVADGGLTWEEGDVDAARAAERSTCFTPASADPGLTGYTNVDESEHFVIHWAPHDFVNQDRIERLQGWLEESYEFQVVERGFYQPWNMSTYQMLVVVDHFSSDSTGAYTTISGCAFGDYMAYVVVNDSWFDDVDAIKSVAPHEFFHAVQYVYGLTEFWSGTGHNIWFIEASAVYVQRVTYPNLWGPEASQVFRWSMQPWRSLETADDTGLQYGLSVFLLSLETSFETNEWLQALWDKVFGRQGFDLKEEMDELFSEDYDSGFLAEWRNFIRRGATMEFVDNPWLTGPLELEEASNGYYDDVVVGEWDGRDYPIEEAVGGESGFDRPEFLGTNYVVFSGSRIDDDMGAVIGFRGSGSKGGVDVEWVVELGAVRDGTIRREHSMELEPLYNAGGEVEDWVGEILVNDLGEDFDFAFMAVSPVTDFGDGGVTWHYTGTLHPSWGNGGFVPVPVEEEPAEKTGCR